MATTTKKAPTLKELFEQQPAPLAAGPDEAESYLGAIQNRYGSARDASERSRLRREAWDQIQLAGLRSRARQPESLETLNLIFRSGKVPGSPLDGFYKGLFVSPATGRFVDRLFWPIASAYMPWNGKRFSAANQGGDNLLDPSAKSILGTVFPSYKGYTAADEGKVAAFNFRTYAGVGRVDADRHTLSLDYDLDENPALIRRITDELVELVPGVYLGKMLLRRSKSAYTLVAYFALTDL